jgi:hypothetical protein
MRLLTFTFLFYNSIVLVSCQNEPTAKVTVHLTPSDTVLARETTVPAVGNYKLSNLKPELKRYMADRLSDARLLVRKYAGNVADSPFDAEVLDNVLDRWRAAKEDKEKPDKVIEALGFALGQGLVDSLDMEWQVWSDSTGEDLTVINRKYMINAYPLASAERAYTDKKVGSFQGIRTILIEELKAAEKSRDVKERK